MAGQKESCASNQKAALSYKKGCRKVVQKSDEMRLPSRFISPSEPLCPQHPKRSAIIPAAWEKKVRVDKGLMDLGIGKLWLKQEKVTLDGII